MVLGDDTPDAVRLPPDLGGYEVRVVRVFAAPCPQCDAVVRHLELDPFDAPTIKMADSATLCVAECVGCGFLWHGRKDVPHG